MKNLDLAKEVLYNDDKKIVVVRDNKILYTSDSRGILPMYEVVIENDYKEVYIADRVIGKGAALLCVYGEVKEVYAELISETAMEVLKENNIEYSYKNKCENILNRDQTDFCPIEKISMESTSMDDFLLKLKGFIKKI